VTRAAGGVANSRSQSFNKFADASLDRENASSQGTGGCPSRIHLEVEPGDEPAIVSTWRIACERGDCDMPTTHTNPPGRASIMSPTGHRKDLWSNGRRCCDAAGVEHNLLAVVYPLGVS